MTFKYYLSTGKAEAEQRKVENIKAFVALARKKQWVVLDTKTGEKWLPLASSLDTPPGLKKALKRGGLCVKHIVEGDEHYADLLAAEIARNKEVFVSRNEEQTLSTEGKEHHADLLTTKIAQNKEHGPGFKETVTNPIRMFHEGEFSGRHEDGISSTEGEELLNGQDYIVPELDMLELTENDEVFENIVIGQATKSIYKLLKEMSGDLKTLKTDVATLKTLKTDVATLKTLKTDVATLKTDMVTLKTDMATLKTGLSSLHKSLSVAHEVAIIGQLQQWIREKCSRDCELPILGYELPYVPNVHLESLTELCLKEGLKLRSTPSKTEIDAYVKLKCWPTDSKKEVFLAEITRSSDLCFKQQYKHPKTAGRNSSTKLLYKFVQVARAIQSCLAEGHLVYGACIISPSFKTLNEVQKETLMAEVLKHAQIPEIARLGNRFQLI